MSGLGAHRPRGGNPRAEQIDRAASLGSDDTAIELRREARQRLDAIVGLVVLASRGVPGYCTPDVLDALAKCIEVAAIKLRQAEARAEAA